MKVNISGTVMWLYIY